MSARFKSLSPRALAVIAGVAVLVYAAALWFFFVSPSRSDAASAKEELASAELRLVEAQSAGNRPSGANAPVADVFRLSKAMPASTDQSGLVLELSKLAARSGVRLQGMTQQPEVAAEGGPSLIPVTVTLDGSYRQITKFLRLTRGLVTVRNGEIHARGRLLAVQSVALSEAASGNFPRLDATISLSAYVYDGPIVPPDVPEPVEEPPTPDSTALGSTN